MGRLVLPGDIFDFWRVNMADIAPGKDLGGNDRDIAKDHDAIFETLGSLKAKDPPRRRKP